MSALTLPKNIDSITLKKDGDYYCTSDGREIEIPKYIKLDYEVCTVCLKNKNRLDDKRAKLTCSQPCAGKLAYSIRYEKQLRERYITSEKLNDLTNIIIQMNKYFNQYEYSNIRVLEFHGGGVFYDKVIANQGAQIVSIDCDKKLIPMMNGLNLHHGITAIGGQKLKSLLNEEKYKTIFIEPFDVIYLDYCGWWNEEKFEEVKQLFQIQDLKSQKYSLFFITLNRSREFYKGESKVFAKDFNRLFVSQMQKIIPNYSFIKNNIYKNEYIHGTNKMVTFGFLRGELSNNGFDSIVNKHLERSLNV